MECLIEADAGHEHGWAAMLRGFVESIGRALPWWDAADLAGEFESVF
jgi:hypothetical protein